MFYNIYRNLKDHFCVIMIDMIGMGCSSRPENFDKKNTPQQTIDYFVNYIEQWRIKMNNHTNFFLAAHSFGGYIAAHYALLNHQHIKKVILLSPIGIRVPSVHRSGYDEFVRKSEEIESNNACHIPKYYYPIMKILWKDGNSPFGFLKFFGDGLACKLIG